MKIRNFMGAAALASAVMLSPAATQAAVVESAVAPIETKSCILVHGNPDPSILKKSINLPVVMAEILTTLGIVTCK